MDAKDYMGSYRVWPRRMVASSGDGAAATLQPRARFPPNKPCNILLEKIFERADPGDIAITVPLLSKHWHAWAAPRRAEVRAGRTSYCPGRRYAEPEAPAWLVKELWGPEPALPDPNTDIPDPMQIDKQGNKKKAKKGEVGNVMPDGRYGGDPTGDPDPPVLMLVDGVPETRWWLSWDQKRLVAMRAAYHGNHALLLWIKQECASAWTHLNVWHRGVRLFEAAAAGGNMRVIRWLRKKGTPWNADAINAAAWSGHINVLGYLRASGCRWTKCACASAVMGRNLGALQWLRANGCLWDERTTMVAGGMGFLEILQWARENGCPWDSRTAACAARFGRMEVLEYAALNGCPFDKHVCAAAAFGGQGEAIVWLRARGCPWGCGTTAAAARGGHLQLLEWLKASACPTRTAMLTNGEFALVDSEPE